MMLYYLLSLYAVIGVNGQRPPRPSPPPSPPPAPPTPPAPTPSPPPIVRFSLNGYDCDPNDANVNILEQQCNDPNQIITKGPGEKIECKENFGCCLCKQLVCNGCDGIIANGDSSAFGSASIIIAGTGTSLIDLNGDKSGLEATITGTGVGVLKFSGDDAAAGALVNVVCDNILHPFGCEVGCYGDKSCAGFPYASVKSLFQITNANGIICNAEACLNGIFELINNKGDIICQAFASCHSATITAGNVGAVICNNLFGCKNAGIFLTDPKESFTLSCGGYSGCEKLHLTITITANGPRTLALFDCGTNGCTDLVVTIIAPPNHPVIISEIRCGTAGESCIGAHFVLTNVEAPPDGFCKGCPFDLFDPTFVPPPNSGELLEGIPKFECKLGVRDCTGKTYTIFNPQNGFEIVCSGGACQGANINLIYKVKSTAEVINNIVCSGGACQDLDVIIWNESAKTIEILKIDCSGGSCGGLTVVIGSGNVFINNVVCDANSCNGCTINGAPCV